MNLKAVLLSTLLLLPTSALAEQRVYRESYCYENTEEYVPGYYNSYGQYIGGYVKSDRRKITCKYVPYQQSYSEPPQPQKRTCAAAPIGAIIGGIGGYAATPRVADRWYMIPLGIFGGGAVGNALCQ